MRLAGRMLSIVSSGNDHDQMVTTVISGVVVKRPAPSFDTFEPSFSRWVDVTERAPWGVGARLPLIPFRVLAHNARTETSLYAIGGAQDGLAQGEKQRFTRTASWLAGESLTATTSARRSPVRSRTASPTPPAPS